jgi:hypothetical protein
METSLVQWLNKRCGCILSIFLHFWDIYLEIIKTVNASIVKKIKYLLTATTNDHLDDWLTVHHSITLVDLQLDAQNSCLFTYNKFIKILYMFRALPCSYSGGIRRNCIYAASGIIISAHSTSSFLTGAQDSHLQRMTIPEAAYIQLRRIPPTVYILKMSRVMLEICRGF